MPSGAARFALAVPHAQAPIDPATAGHLAWQATARTVPHKCVSKSA
jgi:hypothetical protein